MLHPASDRSSAEYDDPEHPVVRAAEHRIEELHNRRTTLEKELAAAEASQAPKPTPELVDILETLPDLRPALESAVAFAVLAFHRRFGAGLLVGAAAVALDRIFVGVHYPIDVVTSLFVGLGSALAVTTIGRPYVAWRVRQLGRLSDPIVVRARGRIASTRRS